MPTSVCRCAWRELLPFPLIALLWNTVGHAQQSTDSAAPTPRAV